MIQKMQQNKFIFERVHRSTPSGNFRSVKYKILPSSTQTIRQMITKQARQAESVPKNYQTYKQSWRKPSSLSHKGHSITSYHAEMPEESPEYHTKASYLSTWDQLLTSAQRPKASSKQSSKIQPLRVNLPSIIDFEPSKFTSLDPLFLPIEDIERGIVQLKEALPFPKEQMSQIHHEMVIFKGKIMEQLQNTEKMAFREISRLRGILKADNVEYQEAQMRFKRQCLTLKQEAQTFKQNLQITKPRLDVLQDEIFSNRPFNLTRNEELDEQFPQQYF